MATVRKVAGYGWRTQPPDFRDWLYSPVPANVPGDSDVAPGYPEPPWNQQQAGCCTGEGTAGAFTFSMNLENWPYFQPSPLFPYYFGRLSEGTEATDCGATIRDVVKAVVQWGIAPEALWPLDMTRICTRPSDAAIAAAKSNVALQYWALDPQNSGRTPGQIIDLIRQCVGVDKHPVVFGMAVYESFESDAVAASGVVPMPGANEAAIGGHCMNICGYRDDTKLFKIRNSWGTEWGQGGYGFVPYDYIAQLASDFWKIGLVQ